MKARLLPAVLVALAAAAPAQAATQTISVARAADRNCTAKVLAPGAGVARTTFTAPAEGTLRAQLAGTRRSGDWDLAAFDSRGRLIAGSKAFFANEVVIVNLRPDARVTLQACRVSGKGRSVPLETTFTEFDFETLEQTGPIQMVSVPISGPATIHLLEELGLDVTHDVHDGRATVMLYGDKDREILTQTGLGFDVKVADVNAQTRRFRAQDRRATAAGPSAIPSGRTEYRTLEDVQQELKDMVAKHPDLVRPFNLPGKTFQGRDIQALEIATDAGSDVDGRPVVYLNGIHHAREWPATEVLMEFAWDLLKNHPNDKQLRDILENVRVVLQPYTNVDGFIVSRGAPNLIDPDSFENIVYSTVTGVVLLGGSLEYKRKNCNPYPLVDPSPVCEYKFGTDNNRNYPHTWGGRGASTNPNDQSFRGSGPGSEPETKAVQLQQLAMNSPVLISMHNIASKVLRPPGTEAEGMAPDEEGLKELGRRMADPTGFKNEFGHQLYDVTGGTKDWAYAVTGAAGYTVELGGGSGDEFHGAYKTHVVEQYLGKGERAGRGMREALIAASEWTRNADWMSRISGRAPAGRTLRITRTTNTLSSAVCTVAGVLIGLNGVDMPDECIGEGDVIETPEKVDITTRVPASGRFTWWVNPSSRPYAKAPESYKLTCEQDGTVLQEADVVVKRGEIFKIDLPCGGTLPKDDGAGGSGSSGSGSGDGGSGPATTGCRDTGAPTVTRSRKGVKTSRRGITISGRAKDKGCVNGKPGQPVKGTITKVQVAVARLAGKRCAFLTSKGKARKAGKCKKPRWLAAKGTNKWKLTVRKRLRKGTYVFFVRGFDKSGNVTPARRPIRFRVK